MLDLKLIRENKELIETALKSRNFTANIAAIISIDETRRKIIQEVEALKSAKNKQSEEIGKLKREKKDAAGQMAEVGKLNVRIAELDKDLSAVDAKLNEALLGLPNIPDKSVPVGTDEKANLLVKTVGELPKYPFKPKPHWELGEQQDIMEFEKAVKVSASRFVILKNAGAKLERALISFMLDTHVAAGFTEIYPPFLVNGKSMQSSGQLPKFADELYKCAEDDLYLIPTAEVPLTNMHRDEVLKEEKLPLKYASFSSCFRREAGSYGKDLKGLIRLHQFDKVELFKFANPESSFIELESILFQAEEILKKLNLPYRVIQLCTGDMGFASAKTYDIEVWMPGLNMYKEISSCSNCTDFQARRANIKFKRKATGKLEFVHTLNGSGLAVGRTMAALIENGQQENGDIVIPEALRPYMGGMEKISVVKA